MSNNADDATSNLEGYDEQMNIAQVTGTLDPLGGASFTAEQFRAFLVSLDKHYRRAVPADNAPLVLHTLVDTLMALGAKQGLRALPYRNQTEQEKDLFFRAELALEDAFFELSKRDPDLLAEAECCFHTWSTYAQ